jgi:hypothetical protein
MLNKPGSCLLTLKVEVGGSRAQGQPGLQTEILDPPQKKKVRIRLKIEAGCQWLIPVYLS